MARPEVRHCRECHRLRDGRREGAKRGCWQCWHPFFESITGYRVITGQEIRTHPKWCPIEFAIRHNAKTNKLSQAREDEWLEPDYPW